METPIDAADAPATGSAVVSASPGTSVALSPKREAFARHYAAHGNATEAFKAAFDCRNVSRRSMRELAYRTAHEPAVRARVRELLAQAAERVVVDRAAMIADLLDIATADPSELVNIVTDPCAWCWPAEALAAAIDHGEFPDRDAPREGCERCRGRGVQRQIITDTADMSGPARRLIAGVETKADGSLKLRLVDQLAARRELAELMGWHVSRSESKSLNINANVPVPQNVSAEDVLDLWKATR
jgi:phage terminase small subunit